MSEQQQQPAVTLNAKQEKDLLYYMMGEALPSKLSENFGTVCYLSPTGETLKAYVLCQPEGRALAYPFFYIVPTAFTLDTEGYDPKRLLRGPRMGKALENALQVKTIELIPIKVSFRAILVTDDFTYLTRFASSWFFGWLKGKINSTVVYKGTRLDMSVAFGETFAIPEKTTQPDEPREMKYEGEITLRAKVDVKSAHYMTEIFSKVTASVTTETPPSPEAVGNVEGIGDP